MTRQEQQRLIRRIEQELKTASREETVDSLNRLRTFIYDGFFVFG